MKTQKELRTKLDALGFATAAILSTAKKADEQANKFNPPYNWCGEQAMTKDEADHAQYGD